MLRAGQIRLAATAVPLALGLALVTKELPTSHLQPHRRELWSILAGREVLAGTNPSATFIERRRTPVWVEPPRILHLDEDPEGYFEDNPPPPADWAVLLTRLHDRGLRHVGIALPLEWENPDVLAIAALRRALDQFSGAVLGLPVKDSSRGDAVPLPFQRASVAIESVTGDATRIPIVNSLRGTAPELGGKRTFAGFTRIETEADEAEHAHLLARWNDRVIFALPLALEIARRGLHPDEILIRPGNEIRLGASGPRLPIDSNGRLKLAADAPPAEFTPASAVIAETLPPGFVRSDAPLYLADGRLVADESARWSLRQLPRLDAPIRHAPEVIGRQFLHRPPVVAELAGVVVVSLLCGCCWPARRARWIALFSTIALAFITLALGELLRSLSLIPDPLALLQIPVVAGFIGFCLGPAEPRPQARPQPQHPDPPASSAPTGRPSD